MKTATLVHEELTGKVGVDFRHLKVFHVSEEIPYQRNGHDYTTEYLAVSARRAGKVWEIGVFPGHHYGIVSWRDLTVIPESASHTLALRSLGYVVVAE